MKVLFVLDSLGAGGAEKSTALLLRGLRSLGVDARVAVLRREPEGFQADVEAAGFDVVEVAGSTVPRRIRALRRLIRDWGPDVVHTAVYMADQVGRLASLGTGAKVVSSWVNVPRLRRFRTPADPAAWKIDLVNVLDAATGKVAVDRYHAVTPGVAEMYAHAYRVRPSRVSVVERGRPIDELGERTSERRSRVRASLGLTDSTPLIVAAGRQEHQKAHVDLMRAMAMVHAAHPDAQLMIAGRDGNASAAIRETLASIPASDTYVRLLGHRSDVPDLLAAADVMALSSVFEGTAGIALEAMALGTPIVSTRLDGMVGILEHERNALIVDVGHPDQMAAAIGQLLEEPDLGVALAAKARVDFLDRFTLERSAQRMLEMYRSVLDH